MNKFTITKLPFDILRDIAEKHKKIRKRLGLSQVELAERSGVSLGSIKRFERTGQVAFESLLKLVFILGRLEEFDTLLDSQDDLNDIEGLFSAKTKS